MARQTEFLNLHLPSENEVYNVEVDQNENFEKIDAKLKEWDTGKEPRINKNTGFNLNKSNDVDLDDENKLATSKAVKTVMDKANSAYTEATKSATETIAGRVTLSQIRGLLPRNATQSTAGVTTYGTTTNTALEGDQLAKILGGEYGGVIQTSGTKVANRIYYDNATRGYYLCKVTNTLTHNDSSKFEGLSNKLLLNRTVNYTTELIANVNTGSGNINLKKALTDFDFVTVVYAPDDRAHTYTKKITKQELLQAFQFSVGLSNASYNLTNNTDLYWNVLSRSLKSRRLELNTENCWLYHIYGHNYTSENVVDPFQVHTLDTSDYKLEFVSIDREIIYGIGNLIAKRNRYRLTNNRLSNTNPFGTFKNNLKMQVLGTDGYSLTTLTFNANNIHSSLTNFDMWTEEEYNRRHSNSGSAGRTSRSRTRDRD